MKDKEAYASSGTLIRWVWQSYMSKYLYWVLIALAFMTIESAMIGALSYMMEPMFDKVFVAGSKTALWWVGFVIFGIFVVRAFSGVIQKGILAAVVQRTSAAMREDLLDHVMTLDGEFHQTHPPGYLVQRIQNDVGAVESLWRVLISGIGRDVVTLVVLTGVAVSIDWKWSLVACIGVPFLIAPSAIAQRFVRRRAREARDIGARLATRLDEVFHGIIPVKLNRLETYQSKKYGTMSRELVDAQTRAALGAATLPGMVDFMAGVGFLGVLVFGGAEIIAGEKTIGQFMSFFTAIGLAFDPLRRIGAISGIWQNAAAALERLKELMDARPTISSPAKPKPLIIEPPELRLQDVTLSYGDTKVLKGTTLTAEAGKTTALVGASGAGKSTVFNLLTRLVDPDGGSVSVGKIDTREATLPDLRGLFSVVSQDSALFDETLRDNILLGREDVTDEQLEQVLKSAHVSDFLPNLSQGLDTPVGPRGSALSGGQRQRVAIARALLRDTPVLLLDEATSALDAESEKTVQKALDRLVKGRTTLVIAHRLSTVRDADKIIVMDKGRVVDEGRHSELLERGGIYARLHALQFNTDGPTADELAISKIAESLAEPAKPKGFWARLFWR